MIISRCVGHKKGSGPRNIGCLVRWFFIVFSRFWLFNRKVCCFMPKIKICDILVIGREKMLSSYLYK